MTTTQYEHIEQQYGRPGANQNTPAHSLWILLILSVIAIIPFWTVRYPVMADYPNHLARWFVLFHIRDRAYDFASFYAPAWGLLPYISVDILAMALQHFFSIYVVGKCILSLGVILVGSCTYFFLKETCPENLAVASFSIIVALNPMYLMGSISYEYSLAFCFLVIGLWVNYCKRPKIITAVSVIAGLILVYLSHLTGFAVAGIVMGVYALFERQRWKRAMTLAGLSLPSLLIFILNPIRAGGGASFVYAGLTPWIKLKGLRFPISLYTSKGTDYLFLLALALLVFCVLRKNLRSTLQSVWLAAGAVLLLAYFAAPSDYGKAGAFMDLRILPFAFLVLLAGIRLKQLPRSLIVGLALLVCFRVATVEQMFMAQQPELTQLTASFKAIPRNARVLPLVPLPRRGLMGRGDTHHCEYGIIQRGFLDPVLFHLKEVQPIRLVGSPYCPNIYCDPANATEVDWRQVANSYDYLWVHGDSKAATIAPRLGDVIFSNGAVTVYRIRRPELRSHALGAGK